MERIIQLNHLKQRYGQLTGKRIEKELDDLLNTFWKGYNNRSLFDVSLEALNSFHLELLEANNMILNESLSTRNQSILEENLDISRVITQMQHGKTAYGIVTLNECLDVFIIGDLHSDYLSLKEALQTIGFYEMIASRRAFHVVFLGDYVDRGKNHLKILEFMLCIKYLFPEYVTMLRGNHDGGSVLDSGDIKLPYRIPDEDNPLDYFPIYLDRLIKSNKTADERLLKSYLAFFDRLPYIAFIDTPQGVYQCVHGGIPKPINEEAPYAHLMSLSDITQYKALDISGATILENIMWADPDRGEEDLKLDKKRFFYTEANFMTYCKQFGISKLFRGHEVVDDGVRSHFNQRVFTVFGSGQSEESFYRWVTPKYIWINKEGEVKNIS